MFSVSLRTLVPAYSNDLPVLGHTPRFMFIAVSCFLALLGTAFIFLLLLMSLLSQSLLCTLELVVRIFSWIVWVILECLGGSEISGRKRIDLLFFLVSLPYLNGVIFMSTEFLSRVTYLLAAYFLMASRHRIGVLVASRPPGSPEYRSALLQHMLLLALPSVALVIGHFNSMTASLYTCWTLITLSLVIPYVVDRGSWNPLR